MVRLHTGAGLRIALPLLAAATAMAACSLNSTAIDSPLETGSLPTGSGEPPKATALAAVKAVLARPRTPCPQGAAGRLTVEQMLDDARKAKAAVAPPIGIPSGPAAGPSEEETRLRDAEALLSDCSGETANMAAQLPAPGQLPLAAGSAGASANAAAADRQAIPGLAADAGTPGAGLETGSLPGQKEPAKSSRVVELHFDTNADALTAEQKSQIKALLAEHQKSGGKSIKIYAGRGGAGNPFDQMVTAQNRARRVNELIPPPMVTSLEFDPMMPDDTVEIELISAS